MIVDAHMHIWGKVHGQVAGQKAVEPVGNGMIRIGEDVLLGMPAYLLDCAALAEYVVSEWDAAGVDAGVVVQEYLDGEQNQYLLDVSSRFPGRFFVHGLPDFWKKDEVESEAMELFGRGFRGLKLSASHLLGKIALDDAAFLPIFQHMEEKGYVLAVDLSAGEDQVPEMENILARFPLLKVAVGHFGMPNREGWPGQLILARHVNVYIEGGGLVWLYRDEGYPFPGAIDAILRAKREVGIEKLMWGSDWPRTMVDFTYRQSLDFVRQSDTLSEGEKAAFLGGNAARLYGLPEPEHPRKPVTLITEG
jgi:hypothetical protein